MTVRHKNTAIQQRSCTIACTVKLHPPAISDMHPHQSPRRLFFPPVSSSKTWGKEEQASRALDSSDGQPIFKRNRHVTKRRAIHPIRSMWWWVLDCFIAGRIVNHCFRVAYTAPTFYFRARIGQDEKSSRQGNPYHSPGKHLDLERRRSCSFSITIHVGLDIQPQGAQPLKDPKSTFSNQTVDVANTRHIGITPLKAIMILR